MKLLDVHDDSIADDRSCEHSSAEGCGEFFLGEDGSEVAQIC